MRNTTAALAVDLIESRFGKSTLMRRPRRLPSQRATHSGSGRMATPACPMTISSRITSRSTLGMGDHLR